MTSVNPLCGTLRHDPGRLVVKSYPGPGHAPTYRRKDEGMNPYDVELAITGYIDCALRHVERGDWLTERCKVLGEASLIIGDSGSIHYFTG